MAIIKLQVSWSRGGYRAKNKVIISCVDEYVDNESDD
jgi:hypothetical protein